FFFSGRRRHTRWPRDWSSDVCSSDLEPIDYERTRFEDVVHDVDVVLDTLAGDIQNRSWKVLKKGGILVSIVAPPSADEAAKHSEIGRASCREKRGDLDGGRCVGR